MRHAILVATALATAACGVAPAREDANPIKDRLDRARAAYEADLEKARDVLLGLLRKKEEAAQKAGDLTQLKKARAEREAFADRGELPKGVSTAEYRAAVAKARGRLETAYSQGRKEYTQAGKIAEAEAIDEMMRQLSDAKSPVAVAKRVPHKDPFAVGTVWVGTLKFQREPVPRKSVLAITERVGNQFKGVLTSDEANWGAGRAYDDVTVTVAGGRATLDGVHGRKTPLTGKWFKDSIEFTGNDGKGGTATVSLRLRKP
jgi:hypothetical protein